MKIIIILLKQSSVQNMNISSGKCQAKNRSVRNEVKHCHVYSRLVWNNLLLQAFIIGILYRWGVAMFGLFYRFATFL